MSRVLAFCACLSLVVGCADEGIERIARAVTEAKGDLSEVVKGNNAFAFDLYQQVVEADEGNVFFSPFSISAAFGMTSAGARGETLSQMRDVLSMRLEDSAWHAAFGPLLEDLNGERGRGYTLHVANRLWGQDGFEIDAGFLAITSEHYRAPLELLPFSSDPDGARRTINGWVEEQTRSRVRDLLPNGSVNSLTRLVLSNAIYLKADWAKAFDTRRTEPLRFTLASGEEVRVPTMQQTGTFETKRSDGVTFLRLPYVDDEVSMLVLVPDAPGGLPGLEARLSTEFLDTFVANRVQQEVSITFPKFELETEIPLKDDLIALGVTDLFDEGRADLSGIAADLYVSDAFHKAFVKVDEEGTEAAAATAVVGKTRVSAPMTLAVDRPFVMVIRDDLTGAILFLGRVVDPRG